MTIDTSRLDGVDTLQGNIPLSLLVAYSQAVSLKRIADALERREAPAEVTSFASLVDPIISLGDGWHGGPASGSMADASTAGKPEPVVNTPAVLPAGYTPYDPESSPVADPATGSPVDRNTQVRIACANGKKIKMFAGSAQWRAPADDPFRPIGYTILGDGAGIAADTGNN